MSPRRSTVPAPIYHRSDTHAKTQVVCHEQTLDASTRERRRKEAREQRSRRREEKKSWRNLEAGEARSSETLKQTTSHTRSHTSSPAVFSGCFFPSPTRSRSRFRCVLWSCKNPPETQDSPISEGALRTAIKTEREVSGNLEMNRKMISNLEVHQCPSTKSRVWTK
ncbi:hypothetical protein G5I_11530 [Acromyrmex echinatior]|uniref:Uncharacterized protein n=1 Tax=Acromyrmex echinatior TaxID=103372 RepID=F4WZS2_ACREC|nr:hypothetical protein G5I_11530 [Acromyrmex echinatior]